MFDTYVGIKLLWPIADEKSRIALLNWLMGKHFKSQPMNGVVPLQEFVIKGVPSLALKQAISALKGFLEENPDRKWARYEVIPHVDALGI